MSDDIIKPGDGITKFTLPPNFWGTTRPYIPPSSSSSPSPQTTSPQTKGPKTSTHPPQTETTFLTSTPVTKLTTLQPNVSTSKPVTELTTLQPNVSTSMPVTELTTLQPNVSTLSPSNSTSHPTILPPTPRKFFNWTLVGIIIGSSIGGLIFFASLILLAKWLKKLYLRRSYRQQPPFFQLERMEAENPILPPENDEINNGLVEEARINAAYDSVSFSRQYPNPYRWNCMVGPYGEQNLP